MLYVKLPDEKEILVRPGFMATRYKAIPGYLVALKDLKGVLIVKPSVGDVTYRLNNAYGHFNYRPHMIDIFFHSLKSNNNLFLYSILSDDSLDCSIAYGYCSKNIKRNESF